MDALVRASSSLVLGTKRKINAISRLSFFCALGHRIYGGSAPGPLRRKATEINEKLGKSRFSFLVPNGAPALIEGKDPSNFTRLYRHLRPESQDHQDHRDRQDLQGEAGCMRRQRLTHSERGTILHGHLCR